MEDRPFRRIRVSPVSIRGPIIGRPTRFRSIQRIAAKGFAPTPGKEDAFPVLKFLCCFCCVLLAGAELGAESPVPLAAALESRQLACAASGNGRDQFALTLRNPSPTALMITIPAGLIAAGRTNGQRVAVLRASTVSVPAKGAVEVALPVAALSSRNLAAPQALELTATSEPRLAPLLQALADQPDAPRATSQLAVLSILENVTFAQWREFLGTAEPQPTPAEVTQAIDALGLLRTVAPQRAFALASDAELKARALRNPWCRAKAMAIYGLDFGDGAVPPDLRQLLHTQAGDNCPICRQRALMQKPADIP